LKTLTVEVDSREKIPLIFPATFDVWSSGKPRVVRVKTEVVCLDAGDYRLKSMPGRAVVERKGTVRELCNNLLGTDQQRQGRAFRKLAASAEFPYLFLHTTATALLGKNEWNPEPDRLVQKLAYALGKFRLSLVVVPLTTTAISRRLVGNIVLNLLVGHAIS